MDNLDFSQLGERMQGGKNFENSVNHAEREEEIKHLKIGDKFWSRMCQLIGGPDSNAKNIGLIKLSFNDHSYDQFFIEEVGDNGKIIAFYEPDTATIHFNVPYGEVSEDQLAELVSHELVHYAQDITGKFSNIGNVGGQDDLDSPWEQEAHRLDKILKEDFKKYFSIE